MIKYQYVDGKEYQKVRLEQSGKIFIRSFGCQMNDADSEVMERLLEREGYGKIAVIINFYLRKVE